MRRFSPPLLVALSFLLAFPAGAQPSEEGEGAEEEEEWSEEEDWPEEEEEPRLRAPEAENLRLSDLGDE